MLIAGGDVVLANVSSKALTIDSSGLFSNAIELSDNDADRQTDDDTHADRNPVLFLGKEQCGK